MANVKRVVSGLFLLSRSWGLGGALDDGLHLRTGCTSPGAYRFDLETLSLVAEAKWGPCAGWAPCEAGYFCGEDGVRRPCPPGGDLADEDVSQIQKQKSTGDNDTVFHRRQVLT